MAKEIIEKFVKNTKREVSIDYIQKIVSDYFQMDIPTLQSKTRKRHIVQARQLAMFFAKKYTKASLLVLVLKLAKEIMQLYYMHAKQLIIFLQQTSNLENLLRILEKNFLFK